jgi:restriction system protein
MDYELPPIDVFPSIKDVRYIAARGEFKRTPIPESQRKRMYDDALYRITLASLYKLFQSDIVDAIRAVVFNGWVESIDKATGARIHPCILSIQVNKQEFLNINLAQVDPRLCFKKLKGVCGSRLAEMNPVQPVISLNKQDPRFVDAYNVAETLNDGTNLAAMDWLDFENLIRELFEKEFSQNGGEVKITQASRDGGVDAVAFDPDPIRGGKIVIQAKRYTNVVGVSAVRDLYGTVHNEGATKGILVTTSDFGPDAYEFAKGKPLTLLSGSELLYLLQRHGYRARIDLADAKKLLLAMVPPKLCEQTNRVK